MTTYRDDVAALAARKAALDEEVQTRTRERDETARMLDEARVRSRLPVLPNIRVASPCTASWDTMVGDERVRHCADCDKDVFNLSAMTRDEAESLLTSRGHSLCVRYYQRKDGTILLADCEVGRVRQRRLRYVGAGVAVAITATTAAWPTARAAVARPTAENGEPMQVLGAEARDLPDVPAPSCNEYRREVYAATQCETIPDATRLTITTAYDQAETSWASLADPGAYINEMDRSCADAAAAIRTLRLQYCPEPDAQAPATAAGNGNSN